MLNTVHQQSSMMSSFVVVSDQASFTGLNGQFLSANSLNIHCLLKVNIGYTAQTLCESMCVSPRSQSFNFSSSKH